MQYKITRKYIKNIIIRLDKYGNIKVSAPHYVKLYDINHFVESNRTWIESRQKILANNRQTYENNAKIPYFEKYYTLRLIQHSRHKILLNGDYLDMQIQDINNTKKIEKSILAWYSNQSKMLIQSIISKYSNAISRDVCSIRFRSMTTRWGSCNTKKATITLNTILFSKPAICLEYVLLHELIHLIYANHGVEFYRLLESLMPNWRQIKKILENQNKSQLKD